MTKKGSELFRAGTSCLSDISPLYRAAAVLTTKKAPCRARNAAAYIKRDIEDAVPYRRLAAFIRRAGPVCPAEECALSVWADRVARPYRRSTQRRQKGKQHSQSKCCFLVGDGGFEPPKALPADLQSVPFGHSGNPPYTIWNWSWWTDSNPRPADYKSAALPAELHQHLTSEPYYNRGFLNCQLQTSYESRKFIALKLCNIHKRT